MRSRGISGRTAAFALTVALVIAQTVAFAHYDLDSSHASDDNCAFCAGLSMLGAANVAAPTVFVSESQQYLAASCPDSHWPNSGLTAVSARGPPPTA